MKKKIYTIFVLSPIYSVLLSSSNIVRGYKGGEEKKVVFSFCLLLFFFLLEQSQLSDMKLEYISYTRDL